MNWWTVRCVQGNIGRGDIPVRCFVMWGEISAPQEMPDTSVLGSNVNRYIIDVTKTDESGKA